MKKKHSIFKIGAILVAFATLIACGKEQDTIGKVNVRDGNNAIVSGASVILKANSTSGNNNNEIVAGDTALSNAAGEAIFNMNKYYKAGQAGVVVFDVIATKGNLSGESVIKIEEEETTEATVVIQ